MSDDAALIERLFQAKHPRDFLDWDKHAGDYLAACQLSREDIPGLLRLVRHWPDKTWPSRDEFPIQMREKAQVLPVTAWRALADLRADEAVQPLIDIMLELGDEFDEWVSDELPQVFGKIGAAAIEPLKSICVQTATPKYARTTAMRGLRFVVEGDPETRATIVPFLVELMTHATDTDVQFNSYLLMELVDLRGVEAAEAIEQAFSRNALDHGMMGDWEKVRAELEVPSLGLPMPEKPYNSLKDLFPKKTLEELRRVLRVADADGDDDDVDGFGVAGARGSSTTTLQRVVKEKIGRNDPCGCGSGKKYKKCCGRAF